MAVPAFFMLYLYSLKFNKLFVFLAAPSFQTGSFKPQCVKNSDRKDGADSTNPQISREIWSRPSGYPIFCIYQSVQYQSHGAERSRVKFIDKWKIDQHF
jgi:hypothetical protein